MRRMASLGIIAALAGGTLLTAAPAQAWCAMTAPNGVYSVFVCSSGDCRVGVLGDTVYTCP